VNGKKNEPKCLINLPLPLREDGSPQRIEEIAGRVSTKRTNRACANQRKVPNAVDAFDKLLQQRAPIGGWMDSRKPMLCAIE
jgi:hypothetical protein